MHQKKSVAAMIATACAIFLLIIDAKTAFQGAAEGLELCIRTVIPSLFPLLLLCTVLNSFLTGTSLKILKPVEKLCGIPSGAQSLFLIGITGGYPVGAKSICQAYRDGTLGKADAERMLGFCSNAGPAFLFGMLSLIFPNPAAPWFLWLIQILCAFITGIILPGKAECIGTMEKKQNAGLSEAMQGAINAMGSVCGWIMIFRVLIRFLNRWVLWLIPKDVAILLTGFLELSNGCVLLNELQNHSVRFIAAAMITAFGGVCVCLQTVSVCRGLSCRIYFIGKLIQAAISVPLSMIFSFFLFPGNTALLFFGILLGTCMAIGFLIFRKNKIYTGNSAVYRV